MNHQNFTTRSTILLFVIISVCQFSNAQVESPKKTIWQQWPALDEYHKVMAKTFHPAENGDLVPLKKYGKELGPLAKSLKKSTIPANFNKPNMAPTVALLYKESKAMSKSIKSSAPDEDLKKSIFALHDRFHEVVGYCKD